MSRLAVVLSAALAAALLASPAEAQWKWKDKTGRVQYSDLPPPPGTPEADILGKPGIQRRTVAVPPGAASSAASTVAASTAAVSAASSPLAPRTVDPELEAKRKKTEAEQAAKTKAEEDRVAAARADNCARAKSHLSTLESGVRLVRANEKGEREFIDDKQRADETRRVRDTIKADCK
ncbi:MAG TPA: DUF4124 domain-containing protein [Caldimonas sp.]|jgi:hypothetical protein|nr:DUF4124 domain-containing protein [Caldimonas sp.]HEX2541679.1 DUF4124 domain-containing protein [Caldimonas sp.]